MNKKILFVLIIGIILSSLSCIYAGWFDNKVECHNYKMENIEGFHSEEPLDLDDDIYISTQKGAEHGGDPEPFLTLYISTVNDTNLSSSDGNILKSYTTDNIAFYMTDEQKTIAYMTKDNYTYRATYYHDNGTDKQGNDVPAEYNEEIFKQDVELLKKHMSTIERK